MNKNLLRSEWQSRDSEELRELIKDRIGGPGQISGKPGDNRLYLPLAGSTCRVALQFKGNRISAIERGVAFDADEWSRISDTIEALINTPPTNIGRGITFSGKRVTGWWRGAKSGVQILPPPTDAPAASVEMAEHPFVLEFPLHSDASISVTYARRLREQRKIALLLNVLLSARINCEPKMVGHAWVHLGLQEGQFRCEWLQQSYFADIGAIVTQSLSPLKGEQIAEVAADEYYLAVGHDGNPLRVPADLDESICLYRALAQADRDKFDRALFWLDVASRHWITSMSSSFASLVSAIESLTERGTTHRVYCAECGKDREHDAPGPTALFRNFFEVYAPGLSIKKRRDEMYALRSGILHGDQLIYFDDGASFGWDPPGFNQQELIRELWSITRFALRNFLRNPRAAASAAPEVAASTLEAGNSESIRRPAFRGAVRNGYWALIGALLGAAAVWFSASKR